jgi:hypothetical protein
MVNHLGPDVAAAISEAVTQPQDGSEAAQTQQATAAAAAKGVMLSSEGLLQQRAEAAANKLLQSLH